MIFVYSIQIRVYICKIKANNMTTGNIKIDNSLSFQFLCVSDTGAGSGACCPHCGAEGRYIYYWAEFGEIKAAMAGCYSLLTGRIKKDDVSAYIERVSVKQAKSKPLNGWDKSVIRMLDYINKNIEDAGKVSWAKGKILDAVRESKSYTIRKFH
jgi:hypothetical protein